MENQLEATFSTLVFSIASSAAMAMGIVEHPETKKKEKNLKMAEFNIDLLLLLKDKTNNNLLDDEQKYLDTVIGDLQMSFLDASGNEAQ